MACVEGLPQRGPGTVELPLAGSPSIDTESIVTGGNGFAKVSSNKTDFSSSLGIAHTPGDSDGSDRYSRPFLLVRRMDRVLKSG